MKIDDISQLNALQNGGLTGTTGSGGQEFAGKLLRAMALKNSQPDFTAAAASSAEKPRTTGTVSRGFGYIMPVISKNERESGSADQLYSQNGGFFDANDPMFSGANASIYSKYAPYFASGMLGEYGAGGYNSGFGLQSPTVITGTGVSDSARANRAVMDGFNVQFNPRYFPRVDELGNRSTYCNRYVNDVTRALGAPVRGGNANGIHDWLSSPEGASDGWFEVTSEQAQRYVNQGWVGVAAWKNPYGHGHVQMISPSVDGLYDPDKGIAISQAGRLLINYGYIADVYRDARIPDVRYFVKMPAASQENAGNDDMTITEELHPGEIDDGNSDV